MRTDTYLDLELRFCEISRNIVFLVWKIIPFVCFIDRSVYCQGQTSWFPEGTDKRVSHLFARWMISRKETFYHRSSRFVVTRASEPYLILLLDVQFITRSHSWPIEISILLTFLYSYWKFQCVKLYSGDEENFRRSMTKNRTGISRWFEIARTELTFFLRFFCLLSNFPSLSRFYLNSCPLCHPARK